MGRRVFAALPCFMVAGATLVHRAVGEALLGFGLPSMAGLHQAHGPRCPAKPRTVVTVPGSSRRSRDAKGARERGSLLGEPTGTGNCSIGQVKPTSPVQIHPARPSQLQAQSIQPSPSPVQDMFWHPLMYQRISATLHMEAVSHRHVHNPGTPGRTQVLPGSLALLHPPVKSGPQIGYTWRGLGFSVCLPMY